MFILAALTASALTAAIPQHMEWIAAHSDLKPTSISELVVVPESEWPAFAEARGLDPRYLKAVYDDGTMFLGPDGREEHIVHELAHHMQNPPEVLTKCQRFTYEAQAWALQVEWMEERGMDTEKAGNEAMLNKLIAEKVCG